MDLDSCWSDLANEVRRLAFVFLVTLGEVVGCRQHVPARVSTPCDDMFRTKLIALSALNRELDQASSMANVQLVLFSKPAVR